MDQRPIRSASGISIGGGGGGCDPGEGFLLLLTVEESEELELVVGLRFLRNGRFTKSRTAMRRRMVAITAAAMMPPWIMFRSQGVG